MPTTTDNDLHALNIRCAALLGDDLTCFNPDGTVREQRRKEACDVWYTANADMWKHHILAYRPLWGTHAKVAWECREGQPWQADIEESVRAYRADPPNYAGDIVLAMGLVEKIADKVQQAIGTDDFAIMLVQNRRSRRWHVHVSADIDGVDDMFDFDKADTLPEAIARAFEAAHGEVRGDG